MEEIKQKRKYNYTKKTGRPRIEIDYRLVHELASIFCTQEEIATILGVSKERLVRDSEFMLSFQKGKENAKSSLRRYQFVLAKTNATMAIWLGKQHLGQRDVVEDEKAKEKIIINNDLPKEEKEESADNLIKEGS